MRRVILILAVVLAGITHQVAAKDIAVKTNLIDDALLDVNVGAELAVAPKWSIDVPASFNSGLCRTIAAGSTGPYSPASRYWFCEALGGHFAGAHLMGGQYNVGGLDFDFKFLGTNLSSLKDSRYEGWFVGAGVSYGYSWILNKHWNIEASSA